jgi:uncharacterized protein
MTSPLLLISAALLAGIMNAVAGGGSFVTFPVLVFTGVPSIIANASSTVALFPGSFASAWAYRKDFTHFEGVSLKAMLAVSIAGGLTGAILLLVTPQTTFDVIVPWLLLFATVGFALSPRIGPLLRRKIASRPATLLVTQFLLGIYGGYFGGAVGLIMLSLWSVFGLKNITAMNAKKTLLAGAMNSAAVVCFIIAGKIWWIQTGLMLTGAVLGGYLGARVARHMNPIYVRALIIAISVMMTIAFFRRPA